MNITEQIQRMLLPIKRRIYSIVSKAVLLEYKHSGALPLLKIQLGKDEVREGVEMVQPYGLASRPKAGAEVIPLFIGGMRDHGVAVIVDVSGTRIKLSADGDVALYRETGEKVYLSQGKIKVEAPSVEITAGDIKLGTGVAQALMNKTAMDAFNSHTHVVTIASLATPTPTLVPTIQMVDGVNTTNITKGV